MLAHTDSHPPRTLIPSIPGGPARQWRVQFQPVGGPHWRLYASFARPEPAEACVRDLETHGLRARVLAVRIMPTSA